MKNGKWKWNFVFGITYHFSGGIFAARWYVLNNHSILFWWKKGRVRVMRMAVPRIWEAAVR